MRNRKLIFTAVFALVAATFNACIEDPEPVALDVVVDAFVQKTMQDGEEKYALAFWSFANKSLESVSAEGPDDETWELEKEAGSSLVFKLFPETAQYTDSMPTPGDYTFTITSTQSDEAPVTIIDKLENKDLSAVTIDSTQYANSKLKITWTEVEDADDYLVRLYDDEDNLIFVSPSIADNKTDYSFGNNDAGWASATDKALTGESYRIELLALLYESTSTSANEGYNIQFISIASKEIVWGD